MGTWPDVEAYKAWARIDDTVDDASITASLAAATAAILERCPRLALLPPDGPWPECPDDVVEATLLWTNRLVARRNSPTGVVGNDDTGQATVPGRDADITRLISPWREPVLG